MEENIYGKKYQYIETKKVPGCFSCKYRWNYPQMAPCCNCQGCNSTGKSFFTSITEKAELKKAP